ncbi:MAG: methionine-S-sulfoxide reductase [Chitinophagales bacterium]|jgi:methionine-S-sulfoxide reductase
MNKHVSVLIIAAALSLAYLGYSHAQTSEDAASPTNDTKTAVFAGGCFWCIESDFEKLEGVIEVESGYTGGSAETADYKTVSYTETGHYEAVEVKYDPSIVSYAELVEYFWLHIDPTDPEGQFCDRGSSYRSAIFYADESEKSVVEKSLANLANSKPFDDDIVTVTAQARPFYSAEDYHQDYYKKNPIRYRVYRTGCGRDRRIAQLWGG